MWMTVEMQVMLKWYVDLIFYATCRLPVAEVYSHTDLLIILLFFSLCYLHEVITVFFDR